MFFGNYAGESIEWLVLDRQPDRVLLISQYGLDCRQFHNGFGFITWENCALRKWLNDEFINEAFSANERERIVLAQEPANRNPTYSKDAGSDTQDKVFLLSLEETEQYFSSDTARRCRPTSYALEKGRCKTTHDGYCAWWLRSPGNEPGDAAFVLYDGSLFSLGVFVFSFYAVRPALWLNLES